MDALNINSAKQFIKRSARPLELAMFEYFFEGGPRERAIDELARFQNPDGGFGHALEADNWNPASSPITTNDAIFALFRLDALGEDSPIRRGIARYLNSRDSFDAGKRRWRFAIESNLHHPHAIWWEPKDDGITGFNPTASLAAFGYCYGENPSDYAGIVAEAFDALREDKEMLVDDVKCYLLAREILKINGVTDLVDLDEAKILLSRAVLSTICKDIDKYGREYVPAPSDFFSGIFEDVVTDGIREWMNAEAAILGKLQMETGGFDITWKWYTGYPEFTQARAWWQPRITLEKLLFACRTMKK